MIYDKNKARETLAEALKVLEHDGWCQGTTHNPIDGTHCSLGAIEAAIGIDLIKPWFPTNEDQIHTYNDAAGLLAEYLDWDLPDGIPTGQGTIAMWNDQDERSYEDVMLLFKRAIHSE